MRLLVSSKLFIFGMAVLWASTLFAGPPQRAISVDAGFADPDSAPVVSAPDRSSGVEKEPSSPAPIQFTVYRSPEPITDDWSETVSFSDEEDVSYLDAFLDDMEAEGDIQFVGYRPRIPNVGGFSGQRIGQGNNLFSGQRFSRYNNGFSGQRIGQGNNFFSGQRIGQGNNLFGGQRIGRYNNGFSGQRIGQGNNLFSGQRVSSNRYRRGLYVPRYNYGWGALNLLRGAYVPNYYQQGFYFSSASPGFYGSGCR